MHPTLPQRIKRVSQLIIECPTLIFDLFGKMLFHGLFQFVFVHASECISVIGGRMGTDLELLEKFGFNLLSEDLTMVFGVLEVDTTDEFLTLHLTHFLPFFILLYKMENYSSML